ARRGWLAVGSLRLIAAAPFALVNYCCALSSVRLLPYVVATVVGVLPGTVAVVVLGDALTGAVDPTLLLFSAACFALGLAGLAVDLRHALRNHQAAVVQNDP
ncbi:MAG: TVP38/TMEM64 family protein, partial [Mycobacteriaceae bacterium]|nr:TVP38/TMEM64 family protein [Mycobacteriaceae bacterium]